MRSGSVLLLAAALLATATPLPGRAFTPPPPLPPCVPAKAGVSVAALGAIIAGDASAHIQQCAVKELAARGAAAMPVVLPMLGPGKGALLFDALEVVTAIGPDAHAALPLLMAHIRQPPAILHGMYRGLYDAVGALGPAARPAIPLLLVKARDPHHGRHALEVLGKLGKYDGRVVPQLIAMLAEAKAARTLPDPEVLDALAAIGKDARGALPTVLSALEAARAAGDGRCGWAALGALAAIGEPGESLPVLVGLLDDPVLGEYAAYQFPALGSAAASGLPQLIDKLQRSRGQEGMSYALARALAAIAPASPALQRQLLDEATRHGNGQAAYSLAGIKPLPPDFAAPLAAALAKDPDDVGLRKALANTRQAR